MHSSPLAAQHRSCGLDPCMSREQTEGCGGRKPPTALTHGLCSSCAGHDVACHAAHALDDLKKDCRAISCRVCAPHRVQPRNSELPQQQR